MIIKIKKKEYFLKDSWNDLNKQDFLFIIKLFILFVNNQTDAKTLKKSWFFRQTKIRKIKEDEFYAKKIENIELISSQFNFLFDKNDASLNFYRFYIDCLKIKRRKYNCTFFLQNNIPITSILAGDFSDAFEAYNLFVQTQKEDYLNVLIASLYKSEKDNNSAQTLVSNASKFNEINSIEKYAILFQFRSLLQFINTNFSILFSGTQDNDKFSLGFSETIYETIKLGYGNHEKVRSINLFDFLQIQLKNRIDDLKEMKANGIDPKKIASITGISIEDINRIL